MEIFFVIIWICTAVLCARIAQKKGREPIVWGAVGCLTSFIGLLILAICDDKKDQNGQEK